MEFAEIPPKGTQVILSCGSTTECVALMSLI